MRTCSRCWSGEGLVQLAQAEGEGGDRGRVGMAPGDLLQQFREADRALALQRGRRVDDLALGDADRVDDHEVGLGGGVLRDAAEVVGGHDADAAPLHLLEVAAALHRPHEHHDLDRLDVGAGGDHVDGDDDARVVVVAELGEEGLRRRAGGAVGDLLAEVVALAEFLADDRDDVIGVGVVLGEDERFRHLGAVREDLGLQLVAEGADDGADLVDGDDIAVELVRGVGEILVERLPAFLAGLLVAVLDLVRLLDDGPFGGDAGADGVDVVGDVDVVADGVLVGVFHDEVLVEEAEGLLVRGGGEADEVGVEVVEHLPPEVEDGAVGLVDDDDVEGLDGDRPGCRSTCRDGATWCSGSNMEPSSSVSSRSSSPERME